MELKFQLQVYTSAANWLLYHLWHFNAMVRELKIGVKEVVSMPSPPAWNIAYCENCGRVYGLAVCHVCKPVDRSKRGHTPCEEL